MRYTMIERFLEQRFWPDVWVQTDPFNANWGHIDSVSARYRDGIQGRGTGQYREIRQGLLTIENCAMVCSRGETFGDRHTECNAFNFYTDPEDELAGPISELYTRLH